uniref:BED-type domain-containing protein n=1 Tax=Rhizophagus irregularis (strain DAOM 181602 / DAOM 197198 / MUCL 43194) TaxID=747089 RepID=U9TT23_RHIID
MDDNEPNDDFSEYIDYRNIEDIEESLSGSSKFASSTTTSKRSSFNSQQQQVKKLKLSKSEKSFVWKYFERIDDGKVRCIMSITKNGKEEPCNATYKYLSFTLNMKYHLNSLHNITEGEEQEEPKVQQAKIDSIFGKAKSHGKSHQHKLNILLLEFIITDSQPFHILKNLWMARKEYRLENKIICVPIIRLNATLHLEDDRSNKIDGERLQKIMLCEEEWIFLKELCKLFKPFDEMTTYFSGVEYVTISSILPIVETLKLIYKTKLKENYDTEIEDLNDINLDNITIIDDSENMKENLSDESEEENKISDDSESDETSNEPIIIRPHKHNLHKKKSQPESANSDQIIKRVLVTIKVACQN